MTRITVTREIYLPNLMDAVFDINVDVTIDRGPAHPDDACGGEWETTVEATTATLIGWYDDDGEVHSRYEAVLRWGPGMVAEFEDNVAKDFTADDLTQEELEDI